ncbi:hypothetical protein SAY86_011589 [Trapa natans]|uniref:Ribosomal RNA-processing protein 7 C-terminal domain-containing protein n=1 Tax=Trapa natans TaxID=22666 RepID=A0AAN7R594_TRANT|nr:hypothetical protein SAY86_011589 [Trapa natans]
MSDGTEAGVTESGHSEKKRKKNKSKKGRREGILGSNGSEINHGGKFFLEFMEAIPHVCVLFPFYSHSLCSSFLIWFALPEYTLSVAVEGKKRKKARMKKEKTTELNVTTQPECDAIDEGEMVSTKRKLGEKMRKRVKRDNSEVKNAFQAETEKHGSSTSMNRRKSKKLSVKKSKRSSEEKKVKANAEPAIEGPPEITAKSRRGKRKNYEHIAEKESVGDKKEPSKEEVYHIPSEDEDSSKGMKKWLMEYRLSRPGLKILQQKIDEFIIAHEEKLDQERKEREALAAEGGWTVVTHHKGRKKTTDSETGTVVGSVSETALREQTAKKKPKEIGLDFYRFQKRDAQRNEIMMLQNKFEQDKKRIQQLRAARKFRPY